MRLLQPQALRHAHFVLVFGLLLCNSAMRDCNAAILNPGETISISGTTVVDRPELSGGIILAEATRPFELILGGGFVAPPFAGTVQERVVRELVSGTLTFYYQVNLDAAAEPVAPSFGIEYFYPVTTDVDFLLDSSGVGDSGIAARRLADRILVSFFIGLPYAPGPPIHPGESSRVFL